MDELKKIDRDVEYEKQKTQLKKEKFIKEIKNGLGNHIKHKGGKVKKVERAKKSNMTKFWERLMNMF